MLVKQIFKIIGLEGADWIDVAQNRDKYRVLLNAMMKLRVP
jgi:hypothetical protein